MLCAPFTGVLDCACMVAAHQAQLPWQQASLKHEQCCMYMRYNATAARITDVVNTDHSVHGAVIPLVATDCADKKQDPAALFQDVRAVRDPAAGCSKAICRLLLQPGRTHPSGDHSSRSSQKGYDSKSANLAKRPQVPNRKGRRAGGLEQLARPFGRLERVRRRTVGSCPKISSCRQERPKTTHHPQNRSSLVFKRLLRDCSGECITRN